MNKKLMWAPFAAILSVLPLQVMAGVSQSCVLPDEAEVAALFERWNDSLATGEPSKVTANYLNNAVLLPTVSNDMRTNHEEIEAYFVDFLPKKPQGVIDQRVISRSCNTASDVGIYTFTFEGGEQVQARYSYLYDYVDGQWLIRHHHSSAMPE